MKTEINRIDEELIKNIIAGDDPSEQGVEQNAGTKAKRKKDYHSVFLEINPLSERHSIYISNGIYNKISILIRLLGNKLTIGGYVDNVLKQHLEQYSSEISEIINQQISQLKP